MSYYTKNENKKYIHIHIYRYVYLYIYIIEFKQIGFSSEVSLIYKQEKGFQKGRTG